MRPPIAAGITPTQRAPSRVALPSGCARSRACSRRSGMNVRELRRWYRDYIFTEMNATHAFTLDDARRGLDLKIKDINRESGRGFIQRETFEEYWHKEGERDFAEWERFNSAR